MLKKLVSIKNVGRFRKHDAVGDIELKRYNVFFAENGRGKTTLCAILRSLQSGNAAHVLGRTTLGTTEPSEILILAAGKTSTFLNGRWSNTVPEIAIFDSTFVSKNVFSGDYVDIDHKRSLYRVIVGKDGVKLATEIEKHDAASRDKASEISQTANFIQVHVPVGMTLPVFVSIKEDPDIDEKIAVMEKELEAVKQASQIKNRASFIPVTIPAIPAGFSEIIARTIDDVAADVEKQVVNQIQAHSMNTRGEAWLSEGLNYVLDKTCPFCGQELKPVEALLAAYKSYFSRNYNELRTAISTMRRQTDSDLGDLKIAAFEKVLDQNIATADFWSKFCDFLAPTLLDEPGEKLRALRHAAVALLDRKSAAPLDSIVPDAAFNNAATSLAVLLTDIAGYNETVDAANATINAKKTVTESADIKKVEAGLARLKVTKNRYQPTVRDACDKYQTLELEKKQIEDEKASVRKKLDEYTKKVIGNYERTINTLLHDFHAGFRIAETKAAYPGGLASSTYQILINDVPVDLGDEKTPVNKPSFRNTLSSGDKSTLALAFFIAQLIHDPDRGSKIVVFDDPFNSQDAFRKDHTARKIKECGEQSAQVIVLSHDQQFLSRIWDCLQDKTAERKSLELKRIGLQNTTILEWNIDNATQGVYKADRKVLTEFYHDWARRSSERRSENQAGSGNIHQNSRRRRLVGC